jgi:hypothetical protein
LQRGRVVVAVNGAAAGLFLPRRLDLVAVVRRGCDTGRMTAIAYVGAALAEIAGCFAFWAWLRMDRSAW